MNPNSNLPTPFYTHQSPAVAQRETSQSPVFFIVPSSFASSNIASQTHDAVNFPSPARVTTAGGEAAYSAYSLNGRDGTPSVYPINQLLPLGSPLPSFSGGAPTYYAAAPGGQAMPPQLAPPPPQAAQAHPSQPPSISYYPVGTVEQQPAAAGQVTYMIMNPNLLSQDSNGFFHYPAAAPSASLPLQRMTGVPSHANPRITLVPMANQRAYVADKGGAAPGIMHVDTAGGPTTFVGPAASMSPKAHASGGANPFSAPPPPPPPPYLARNAPSVSASVAAETTTTSRRHGGPASAKDSQRTRRAQPASLSTTCGVRSFVAPAPIGSRFVPNAPLIMSVPSLARRTPEWGVLPRQLVETGAVA